jgi:hypothetical protein
MLLFVVVEKAGFELVRYNDLRAGLAAFLFSFLIIVLLAGIICTFNTVKGTTTVELGTTPLKKLSNFPSPAGMSLNKLSLAGNNLIIPGYGEFG